MATLPTSAELRTRIGLTADEFNTELGDAAIASALEDVCDEAGIPLPADDAAVPLGMRRLVRDIAQRYYLNGDGKFTERIDDYSYQLDASMFGGMTDDERARARRLANLPGSYSLSLAGDPLIEQPNSCCP
jgi:hypothetical protein